MPDLPGRAPPARGHSRRHALPALLMLLRCLGAARAYALSDEIQVYTAEIASPGMFNLTLHDYYVARGARPGDFDGALPPDRSLTGGTEWAYGAARWLELGVYAPIYTLTRDGSWHGDGTEVRALFVSPDAAQRRFFYGLNVALDFNAAAWDAHREGLELRPILGWHAGAWRLTLNPTLDSAFDGPGAVEFSPAGRLDYTLSPVWQLGLEEYADDTGPISRPAPMREQNQRLFAVADVKLGGWSIEPGIGYGLTAASDRLTLKLIVARDLN
jgi:hypothetical protein